MFLRDLWKRRAEQQRAAQLTLTELHQRLAALDSVLDPTLDQPALPGRTWLVADLELLFPLLLDRSLAAATELAENTRLLVAQYGTVLQALQARLAQLEPGAQDGATATYGFQRSDDGVSALHARFVGTLHWLQQRAMQQNQGASALGSAVPLVAWNAALYDCTEHLGDESGLEAAMEMGRAGSRFNLPRQPSQVVTPCTPAALAAEVARLTR